MHTLGCPTGAGKPPAAGLHLGTLHLGPRHPRQEISVHTLGCPTTTCDGRTVHLGTWGLVSQQRAPDKYRPAIKQAPDRTNSNTQPHNTLFRKREDASARSATVVRPPVPTAAHAVRIPARSVPLDDARTHARTIRQAPSMPLVSHSPPPRGSPNTHLPPTPHQYEYHASVLCEL